ncbi:hypothetical protein ANO11243_030540 [Dothideomycetidae sp. 11243]|nr:hypothetical protein ANO11243_030540 [fungal sp. No.11243]
MDDEEDDARRRSLCRRAVPHVRTLVRAALESVSASTAIKWVQAWRDACRKRHCVKQKVSASIKAKRTHDAVTSLTMFGAGGPVALTGGAMAAPWFAPIRGALSASRSTSLAAPLCSITEIRLVRISSPSGDM